MKYIFFTLVLLAMTSCDGEKGNIKNTKVEKEQNEIVEVSDEFSSFKNNKSNVVKKSFGGGDLSGWIYLTYTNDTLTKVVRDYGAPEYNGFYEEFLVKNGELYKAYLYEKEHLHELQKSLVTETIYIQKGTTSYVLSRSDTTEHNYENEPLNHLQYDTVKCNVDSVHRHLQKIVKQILYDFLTKGEIQYYFQSITEYPYYDGHNLELITLDSLEENLIVKETDEVIDSLLSNKIKKGQLITVKWIEERDDEDNPIRIYKSR